MNVRKGIGCMDGLTTVARGVLAFVLAMALSLPTPALAWAVSGDLAAGSAVSGAIDTADAAEIWDGSVDVSWYVESPDATSYTLSTPAQLAGLAALVNGTSTAGTQPLTFKGKTIRLGADIWLNAAAATGYDSSNTQHVWTPIGDLELLLIDPNGSEGAMPMYADNRYFDGTFDGGGHVVKNIYIYRNEEGTYGGVQALFANVGGNAVIQNVGIDGGWVMGRVAAGLVAISHATAGHFPQIIGCFNTANITGNGSTTRGVAGIFAGEEQYRAAGEGQEENYHGGAIIANCYNTGTIAKYSTSSPSAGGIAGTGSVQIYGCYNTGRIDISSRYAGALAGCLVAPGYAVGQGQGAIMGESVVSDTYAMSDCIPADDQDLVKLYNMIDAQHPKGDVDRDDDGVIVKRNPGVTSAETAGFKPSTWFRSESAWKDLSQSFVYSSAAAAPQLYWQSGQQQINFLKKDDYGFAYYEVWGIGNQPYTGSALKPKVIVTYDPSGTGADDQLVYLHEGSDYVVEYSNNVEKGTAGVTVTGIGRFYNAQTTTFNIIGSDLNEATIQQLPAQWWYGAGTVAPEITVLATNGDVLKEGQDYTVSIAGIPDAEAGFEQGKATATVTVTSADETKFTGSKSMSFTVLQAATGLADADGDGYYEIGTKGELQYLAYVTSQKAPDTNATVTEWGMRNYKLTADIDARAHCDEGDDAYLTDRPVDPLFSYYYAPNKSTDDQNRYGGFSGTFDGAGHSIMLGQTEEGLSLDEGSALALFVYTKRNGTSVFKDLTINGSLYAPTGVAAGLLIMAQPGSVTVENCVNNASAEGNLSFYGSAAGFIVETASGTIGGNDATELVMRNCTNNGEMKSAARAAGIVGALGGATSKLEKCTNNGAITAGSLGGAGGIVAFIKGAENEASAYATFEFDQCANTGDVLVRSNGDAGGIVGWNQDPVKQVTFTRCSNTGRIAYAGGGNNGAGIMGRAYSPATFVNCYNNAEVAPRGGANAPAGILGYAGIRVRAGVNYGDIVMRNVYSAGGFGLKAADAGGIVGIVWLHNRLTFDNCYYETGAGAATKEIGYNWGDFSDTAIDPPVIVGECVQMDSTSMRQPTFATLLGAAFAPDAASEATGEYANGGLPVFADAQVSTHDLSASDGAKPAYTVTGSGSVQYTGAPIEIPDLGVQDSAGNFLVKGVDYVVFYSANGTTGTAVVQGVGAYTGSIEKGFTIVPCDIASCKGLQAQQLNYADFAGGEGTMSFSLKNPAGREMVEGTDYEVLYAGNTAPGQGYVLVKGKAPFYTGSAMRLFTVTPGDLGKVKVGNIADHYALSYGTGGLYVYEELTAPSGYVLKRSDAKDANNDYVRVFYEYNEATGAYDLPVRVDGSHDDGKAWAYNISKAGKYLVELRGDGTSANPNTGETTSWTNGYWVGKASATFTYGNRIASDEDLSVAGMQQTYGQTGRDLKGSIKPILTNKNTDYGLEEGVDYELGFKVYDDESATYVPTDVVEATGSYKLVITGINNWFGTREVPFQVTSAQFILNGDSVVSGINAEYFHTGAAVKPVPSSVRVVWNNGAQSRALDSSEYTVSYVDAKGAAVDEPTEVGTYYAVIAGAGVYQGSKRVAFSIVKPHLTVYVRTGSGAAALAKRYTKADFEKLAMPGCADSPVSALYCDKGGSNWSVASTANYVTLEDLLDDAGVIWADGASMTYGAGAFGGPTYTYADLQKTMFYPMTTAAATDSYLGRKAPFVLSITDASTKVGGSTSTTFAAEVETANVAKASAETAPRAIVGVLPDDYAAPSAHAANMMGSRLVKGVDTVTVTLPVNAFSVTAVKQLHTVAFNASKATTLPASALYAVSGAHGAVSYKRASGNGAITVAADGSLSLAKGLAAGTYPLTVTATDAGAGAYAPASRTVSFTVQVTAAASPSSQSSSSQPPSSQSSSAQSSSASSAQPSAAQSSAASSTPAASATSAQPASPAPAGTAQPSDTAAAAPSPSIGAPAAAAIGVGGALQVQANDVTVAYRAKKARSIAAEKIFTVTGAQGALSFAKVSGSAKLKVSAAGVVTVAKGARTGTYRANVSVADAAGNQATVQVSVKVKKAANTLKAKGKAVTVARPDAGPRTVKAKAAYSVKKAKGKVSYKKVAGPKAVSVNARTGALTVRPGTAAKTYTLKVKVKAAGTKSYKAAAKTVKVKLTVA